MLSADNFWIRFEPRWGPTFLTKHQAWSGFKLFDTDGITERILQKNWFWKIQTAEDQNAGKITREGGGGGGGEGVNGEQEKDVRRG